MAKKTFSPKEKHLEYARFCHNIGVAVVIRPTYNQSTSYWVEKYNTDDHKKTFFLRIDLEKKDIASNRQVFSEYEALEKCFEMYKLVYDKNNK